MPKHIEVFDVETIVVNNRLTPYSICYTDNNKYIYTIIENKEHFLLNLILNNFKDNTIYYAHNLLFDFTFIFKSILELKVEYNWLFLNYQLYEVIIITPNKKITLRCSVKLIPISLKKFYPSVSSIKKLFFPYEFLEEWCPEKKTNLFTGIEEKYHNMSIEEYLKIYCINDCAILLDGLNNFYKVLTDNKIFYRNDKFTSGSIALAYYIKNWNKISFNINSEAKTAIRKSYYGGRCEVFGNPLPERKILYFNFKEIYKQCMVESLPYDDFTYLNDKKLLNVKIPGFYNITINYDTDLPLLPERFTNVYFKTGNVSGWFWHEEVEFCLNNFKINSFVIHEGYISNKNGAVLSEFINELHKVGEKNSTNEQIVNILINSLHTRLLLKDDLYNIIISGEQSVSKNYDKYGNFFITKREKFKITKSNIAISSAISSKVRIKLYQAYLDIINSGGRLLYSDTDGIFAEYKHEVTVENKLIGKYVFFDTNKPNTVIKDAVFIDLKSYALLLQNNDEFIKIDGTIITSPSFNEIKKIFFSNPHKKLVVDSFPTFKNDFSTESTSQRRIIDLHKYNRRVWSQDFYYTKPLN